MSTISFLVWLFCGMRLARVRNLAHIHSRGLIGSDWVWLGEYGQSGVNAGTRFILCHIVQQ